MANTAQQERRQEQSTEQSARVGGRDDTKKWQLIMLEQTEGSGEQKQTHSIRRYPWPFSLEVSSFPSSCGDLRQTEVCPHGGTSSAKGGSDGVCAPC